MEPMPRARHSRTTGLALRLVVIMLTVVAAAAGSSVGQRGRPGVGYDDGRFPG